MNQNGVVMMADARLDEMNCCAQTTNTIPPTKITSPQTACLPISRADGKGSLVKIQKIDKAVPAISNRSAESKNGGKLFNATWTPKNVEPQMRYTAQKAKKTL